MVLVRVFHQLFIVALHRVSPACHMIAGLYDDQPCRVLRFSTAAGDRNQQFRKQCDCARLLAGAIDPTLADEYQFMHEARCNHCIMHSAMAD